MGFAVSTKRSPAMMGIVKVMMEDYLVWAVGRGDSIGHREIVEPHNNEVHEMDQHDRWKSFVWKGT